jgi:hypothetical protein
VAAAADSLKTAVVYGVIGFFAVTGGLGGLAAVGMYLWHRNFIKGNSSEREEKTDGDVDQSEVDADPESAFDADATANPFVAAPASKPKRKASKRDMGAYDV